MLAYRYLDLNDIHEQKNPAINSLYVLMIFSVLFWSSVPIYKIQQK